MCMCQALHNCGLQSCCCIHRWLTDFLSGPLCTENSGSQAQYRSWEYYTWFTVALWPDADVLLRGGIFTPWWIPEEEPDKKFRYFGGTGGFTRPLFLDSLEKKGKTDQSSLTCRQRSLLITLQEAKNVNCLWTINDSGRKMGRWTLGETGHK